ncbi:MAG: glycosyltransferase [Bacteroidia bacterium]|nr:glycosyltransferase [Bacteroidia bacterium]
MREIRRAVFACGGTGGHVFPAVAIADELRRRLDRVQILFVGAENGMENELVPRAGYEIVALPIAGFRRRLNFANIRRNLLLPLKFARSFWQSVRLLRSFRPDLAVGTGGYASFPVLRASAGFDDVVRVVQEQNAYPGLANRLLAPFAHAILLGDSAAQKYFPPGKCRHTGNPVTDCSSVGRSKKTKSSFLSRAAVWAPPPSTTRSADTSMQCSTPAST